MRKYLALFSAAFFITAHSGKAQNAAPAQPNPELAALADRYYEEGLKLNPLSATTIGDNRYNHLLYIDFTEGFRATNRKIYQGFLDSLKKFDRQKLSAQDKINYDVLRRELEMGLERLSYPENLMVFSQFGGVPQTLALLGSGSGSQPFKTVQDYEAWLKRASVFSAWADSAIVYFRKGMAQNMVLPKVLVEKMIPQMAALADTSRAKSSFYGPIQKFPEGFSEGDKQRLTTAYTSLIQQELSPAYTRLRHFLEQEYLTKARTTSGYAALPGGKKMYDIRIRYFTTTNMTADEVYNLGLKEVARSQKEMEAVKKAAGFQGDLKAFFEHMRTDPKFYPYKTPEEILDYYRSIQQRIEPTLSTMFNHTPKTPFEVRQTEAFRAASAAAQYFPGSLENGRPGIFYVPILDAAKTQARESLFLHEALPGHHYQISLQYENAALPKFRRYGFSTAYMEGWGLYAESLGKELGLYTDPHQYMLALSDEMHRAVRLVVDAGLHAKGWTREQAIQYSLDNEPIEAQRATSEIERYMTYAGQALAYKIGELKLKELRARYTRQLGAAFNLARFHDAILMDGAMPLDVLEAKMDAWAKTQGAAKAQK